MATFPNFGDITGTTYQKTNVADLPPLSPQQWSSDPSPANPYGGSSQMISSIGSTQGNPFAPAQQDNPYGGSSQKVSPAQDANVGSNAAGMAAGGMPQGGSNGNYYGSIGSISSQAPPPGGWPSPGGQGGGQQGGAAFNAIGRTPSYGPLPTGVTPPNLSDIQKGFGVGGGASSRYDPWTNDPTQKQETPAMVSDYTVRNNITSWVKQQLGIGDASPLFTPLDVPRSQKAFDLYSQAMQQAGLGGMVAGFEWIPGSLDTATQLRTRSGTTGGYTPPGGYPTGGQPAQQPTVTGTAPGSTPYSATVNVSPQAGGNTGPAPQYTPPQPTTGGGSYGNFSNGQGSGQPPPPNNGFFGQLAAAYPQLGNALTQLLGPLSPYVDSATSGLRSAYEQTKANDDIALQSQFAGQGSYLSSPMFAYQGQHDANLASQYLKDLGTLQVGAAEGQAGRGQQTALGLAQMFSDQVKQLVASGYSLEAAKVAAAASIYGSNASIQNTNTQTQGSMYNTDVNAGVTAQGQQLSYALGMSNLGVEQQKNILGFIATANQQQLAGQDQQFNQALKTALISQGMDQAALDKLYAAYSAPGTNGLNLLQIIAGLNPVSKTTNPGLGTGAVNSFASGLGAGLTGGAGSFLGSLGGLFGGSGAAAGGAGAGGSLLGGALAFL